MFYRRAVANHQRTYKSPLNRPDSAHYKNDLKIQLSILYLTILQKKMTYDFVKNNTFISPSKRMRKRDYKTLGTSIIYTLQSIQSLLAFRVFKNGQTMK